MAANPCRPVAPDCVDRHLLFADMYGQHHTDATDMKPTNPTTALSGPRFTETSRSYVGMQVGAFKFKKLKIEYTFWLNSVSFLYFFMFDKLFCQK